MKTSMRSLFAFLFILTAMFSVQQASAQEMTKKSIDKPDVTISVKGLACPICAYGLEKRLKKIDSIDKMSIHIKAGEVRMKLKKGESIAEKQIKEAVLDAGFTLTGIKYADKKAESTGRS